MQLNILCYIHNSLSLPWVPCCSASSEPAPALGCEVQPCMSSSQELEENHHPWLIIWKNKDLYFFNSFLTGISSIINFNLFIFSSRIYSELNNNISSSFKWTCAAQTIFGAEHLYSASGHVTDPPCCSWFWFRTCVSAVVKKRVIEVWRHVITSLNLMCEVNFKI